MAHGEASSSRPTWWTHPSSFASPGVVVTASEAVEEFEESSNSDPDDVYVASSDTVVVVMGLMSDHVG